MRFKQRFYINSNIILIILVLIILYPSIKVFAQEPKINWVEGPKTVILGNDIAQLTIGTDYVFVNGDDARKILEKMGNPPSNYEVGLIIPKNYKLGWFVVFDYIPSGYIKDDEKDKIDADAILKSIKKGTEKSNKFRKERGIPPIHVTGWYSKPYYDTLTNNLTWTTMSVLEGHEENEGVNHNIRLLGRYGYMSVVLVADRSSFPSFKPDIDKLVSNFSFEKGKSYAEYVKGDKVAKYGLTALIAGGAAAVAVKTGLFGMLAKFAKYIFLAVLAFFASLWGKIKALFRRSDKINITSS